ncbi:MAG: M23 family metallopeptidase [Bacteroidota bacterium]|nr:M23 family metallopeptidase [Bacteroidota bacterium]
MDWRGLKKNIKDHLDKSFLLIVRNEDTFEETGSYKLSLLNIYVLASSVFCTVGILLFLLITFTPLKRYIPGYGNAQSQTEYSRLQKKLVELDQQINAQNTYLESLKRLLTGKPETQADITKDVKLVQENASPISRIKEDSLLRSEFESSLSKSSQRAQKQTESKPVFVSAAPSAMTKSLEDISFFPPVRGAVGASYKPEIDHFGIDIIAPKNSPIKATLPGSVIQSDWTLENGFTIAIQHENNLISFYKHNSALLKKIGTKVKAGEAIAIIGNTGTLTSGPHLHFELWYQGLPINPGNFVRF